MFTIRLLSHTKASLKRLSVIYRHFLLHQKHPGSLRVFALSRLSQSQEQMGLSRKNLWKSFLSDCGRPCDTHAILRPSGGFPCTSKERNTNPDSCESARGWELVCVDSLFWFVQPMLVLAVLQTLNIVEYIQCIVLESMCMCMSVCVYVYKKMGEKQKREIETD